MMRMYYCICLALLASGVLASPAQSPIEKALVLGFRVEAAPGILGAKGSLLSSNASLDLQQAALFLLEQYKHYHFFSLQKTRALLGKALFTNTSVLSRAMSEKICRLSAASYLFSGHARLSPKAGLSLQAHSYHCRSSRVFASKTIAKIQKRIQLQTALRSLLQELSAFAPDRSLGFSIHERQEALPQDILLVLDFSGSMREDIKKLREALPLLSRRLAAQSRLGAIILESDKTTSLALSADWKPVLAKIGKKAARSWVKPLSAAKALEHIRSSRHIWKHKPFVLFLSDLSFKRQEQTRLLHSAYALAEQGIGLCFFPLKGQDQQSRRDYKNIARQSQAYYGSDLSYAREAFMARQAQIIFLQRGEDFFFTKSRQDLRPFFQGKELPSGIQSIAKGGFAAHELQLESLPRAFARRSKDKLLRLGPYHANWHLALEHCLRSAAGRAAADKAQRHYKLLVKNHSRAFWIYADEQLFSILQRSHPQKNHYLGLHWQSQPAYAAPRIRNFSYPFYIREQSQVPQLLLWKWEEMQKLPLHHIRREDIYFMKLRFLDARDEKQKTDIRY